MQLQKAVVKLGKHSITLQELTTAQETRCRAASANFSDPKNVTVDQEKFDALYLKESVIDGWPQEVLGDLTVDNVLKLPAKYSRPLIFAARKLNTLDENVDDFLGTAPSLTASPTALVQPSS